MPHKERKIFDEIIEEQDKFIKNIKQNELDWLEQMRISGKISLDSYLEHKKEVMNWKEVK